MWKGHYCFLLSGIKKIVNIGPTQYSGMSVSVLVFLRAFQVSILPSIKRHSTVHNASSAASPSAYTGDLHSLSTGIFGTWKSAFFISGLDEIV